MSRKPTSKGFTLVELLVVIGIIALLISILLPSLNKARAAAKTTACMSNLRSVGQAVAIYQAEFKGAFPPAASTVTSNHLNVPHVWSLLKLPIPSGVRYCPQVGDQLTFAPIPQANVTNRFHVSYLYNYELGGFDNQNGPRHPQVIGSTSYPTSYKSVPAPSETMLFMDFPMLVVVSSIDDRGMVQCTEKAQNPLRSTVNGESHQVFNYVAPVHNVKPTSAANKFLSNGSAALEGYVNVLYCDGSVRSVYVKQGEAGLATGNTKGPQTLLDNSTQNGHILAGSRCILKETRFDPYTPW